MEQRKDDANLILYRTRDGKAEIALYARDGSVWLTQQQMTELHALSELSDSLKKRFRRGNS